MGLITVNALTAADALLIPVQCEYYALEGLSQLLNTIKNVKNSFNSELSCLLYTSDAADDLLCVDLGGRRIIKKKKNQQHTHK